MPCVLGCGSAASGRRAWRRHGRAGCAGQTWIATRSLRTSRASKPSSTRGWRGSSQSAAFAVSADRLIGRRRKWSRRLQRRRMALSGARWSLRGEADLLTDTCRRQRETRLRPPTTREARSMSRPRTGNARSSTAPPATVSWLLRSKYSTPRHARPRSAHELCVTPTSPMPHSSSTSAGASARRRAPRNGCTRLCESRSTGRPSVRARRTSSRFSPRPERRR